MSESGFPPPSLLQENFYTGSYLYSPISNTASLHSVAFKITLEISQVLNPLSVCSVVGKIMLCMQHNGSDVQKSHLSSQNVTGHSLINLTTFKA